MLKLSQTIIMRSALGICRARNHSGLDLQNCLRHKVHKQNNNHRKKMPESSMYVFDRNFVYLLIKNFCVNLHKFIKQSLSLLRSLQRPRAENDYQ